MATAPDYDQHGMNPENQTTPQKSRKQRNKKPADADHPQKDEVYSWDEGQVVQTMELVPKAWPQGVKSYLQQTHVWPTSGRHILASYDNHSIVVYQAFCPAIAEAAVKDQRFGGGGFSFTRMSWIKTNFLWMMYRCGWASKPNQERVLAVRITQDGFDHILAEATSAEFQKSQGLHDCQVRLQWDPDHSPCGEKLTRRAIQLGLKDDILKKYSTEWVISITDITPYVRYQYHILSKEGTDSIATPVEQVYTPPSKTTRQRIDLS